MQAVSLPSQAIDSDEIHTLREAKSVEKFLQDETYVYQETLPQGESLMERLRYYLQRLVSKIFRGGGNFTSFFIYLFAFAFFLYILLKLFGVEFNKIIAGKNIAIAQNPYEEESGINAFNIDEAIQKASEARQYRQAIRYVYLKLLHLLSEKELILWKKNKTNDDYRKELKNSALSSDFNKLTGIYEYVWYGEFAVNEEEYNSFREIYLKISTQKK